MKLLQYTFSLWLLGIIFIVSTSCTAIIRGLYNIKNIKNFDKEACENIVRAIKFGNIKYHTIYSDNETQKCLTSLTTDSVILHNINQPIQIWYYHQDSLISYHANCYAQGLLSHLNWNYNNRFNQFIPKSAISIKRTKIIYPLNVLSACLRDSFLLKNNSDKYIVFVFWTRMMEKLSKEAIETVIKNIYLFQKESEVSVYLINQDKLFITN